MVSGWNGRLSRLVRVNSQSRNSLIISRRSWAAVSSGGR
jgi:hypothetical protein